jgi:DNA polymerase III delta subunit
MARKTASPQPATAQTGFLHWGDDRLTLAEAQQALIDATVDAEWASMNLLRLDGGSAAEALGYAGTPPFGPGGRLVIVSLDGDGAQTFLDQLAELWDTHAPLAGNALLIEVPSIDRRRKGIKTLESRMTVRSFALPKSWDAHKTLGPWIDARLALKGGSIAPDARSALIDACGVDTARIAGELDKLLLWQGGNARISLQAVEALVAATEADVFGLLASLANGNKADALVEANQLLARDPRELPKFVAGLSSNLMMIKRAKDLIGSGMSQGDAAGWLGVHPFRLQNLLNEWRRWKAADLQNALLALAEIDRRSKTGQWSGGSLLEIWIIRFPGRWSALPPVSLV